MTDKELLYIKTIAEEKNISSAAKKLYMTQPALSHCLKMLEQSMGSRLFDRTTEGMKLTQPGEIYYEMACHILDTYEEYMKRLSDLNDMSSGRIRMGMTRYNSLIILPDILPEFKNQYPKIDVVVLENNSSLLEQKVLERELDFAVVNTFEDMEHQNPLLHYDLLHKDPFCILVQKGKDMKEYMTRQSGYKFPVLDIRCLHNKPILLEKPEKLMRKAADNIFQRANIEPDIILETEFQTAIRLAAAGMGATIITEQYLQYLPETEGCDIYSIPKKYKPNRCPCIVYPENGYLTNADRKIIAMIQRHAENL